MSQIGEQTLGKEIVSEVDGHAGIFSEKDRLDLAQSIEGADKGWKGVNFDKQML